MSSKSTHQGEEAAECCRLLAYLCTTAIQLGVQEATTKKFLINISESFTSPLYSVQCLASSQQEKKHLENESIGASCFHAGLQDRNWNWRDSRYRYSPSRSKFQPGYVGSYAMDALAMSLHCVYSTSSFEAAVLKAANMRGDADTVAAITGQLAGSIYGAKSIPKSWITKVQSWDGKGRIAYTAFCLYKKRYSDLDLPAV